MASFTGEMTRCSIGRNKHIVAGKNNMCSVGFGATYGGYCGSFGIRCEELDAKYEAMTNSMISWSID